MNEQIDYSAIQIAPGAHIWITISIFSVATIDDPEQAQAIERVTGRSAPRAYATYARGPAWAIPLWPGRRSNPSD